MNPVASVLWRSLNLVLNAKRPSQQMALRRYDSRIPAAANPHKAMTVISLLEKHKPKSIVELGSGESSAWFAAYASKHPGVTVTSIDEWPEWQERETKAAHLIGGVEFQIHKKIAEPPHGWRYDLDLPSVDFVYIDGPYHQSNECGMDVPLMLNRGFRPKVICVDGRTTGVDLIRSMTPDYDFYPQMIWCFERSKLIPSLAMRGQSFFVRH